LQIEYSRKNIAGNSILFFLCTFSLLVIMADKVQKRGVFGAIKSVYHDPYLWGLVKSVAFFAVGVNIASKCVGIDVMGPPQ